MEIGRMVEVKKDMERRILEGIKPIKWKSCKGVDREESEYDFKVRERVWYRCAKNYLSWINREIGRSLNEPR